MKKIIWIFGQSATGKKTLINKLLKHDESTLVDLGLSGSNIWACEATINDDKKITPKINDVFLYNDVNLEKDNAYFNQRKAINRRSCIMTDTVRFINDKDADVLLIKGQDNDIWPNRGDIVKNFLRNICLQDIEMEVFILSVLDDEVWKKRIVSKKWFQDFKEQDFIMKKMLMERKNKSHEKRVIQAFDAANIPIKIIDSSGKHYEIVDELNKTKRGKLWEK